MVVWHNRATNQRGLLVKKLAIGCAVLVATASPVWSAPPLNLPGPQAISQEDRATGAKAHPDMVSEYGGVYAGPQTALVRRVGLRVAAQSGIADVDRSFTFTLLNSPVENAFAIPGGYVYTTRALLALMNNEDELGFVLGHETGHVVARHSAEQIAKTNLTQGLTGAAVIATYDPNNPASMGTAQVAQLIGQLVNLKFGRDDELEADKLGVCFMSAAGYDPQEMVGVMQILQSASQGGGPPEFMSTHPDPGNRITHIQETIANLDQCPK